MSTWLVCGGRDFDMPITVYTTLSRLSTERGVKPDLLIHGGAGGADKFGGRWALQHDIRVRLFPAYWKLHGRSAGPKRNQRMLDEGKPDLVIAFPGGRGTADMVARAIKATILTDSERRR